MSIKNGKKLNEQELLQVKETLDSFHVILDHANNMEMVTKFKKGTVNWVYILMKLHQTEIMLGFRDKTGRKIEDDSTKNNESSE
jgi:hypothetical protein